MGRRKCQIHFVVTASGRAPAPRCFAAQWADCCFSRSVFPFSKVLNKCRAQGLPDRKAGNSSARHILAGAIAPAAETRCPLASRGPKAPASVRPATGGRWPFVVPGRADPQGTVPRRRGKRGSRFLVPPGEEFSGMPCLSGRGHRPCHSAAPVSGPAGGQSPRPAPDPPPAGASPPPGRALAYRGAWTNRSTGHRPARAGKRGSRFLVPPGEEFSGMPCLSGRGHRACHNATLILGQPGAKAPGQRPTRPRRALLARRVGHWPAFLPDLPVYRGPFRAGGGNALRSLFPPGLTKALSPLQWQGPSPLP